MKQKTLYNNFFKKYGPNVHTDPIRFDAIAKLCRGSVLDIGCGTGDLADFYKGIYQGIDISNVAIDMARKIKRPNAQFSTKNVLDPNFKMNRKYNTIVLTEFLEHIKDDYSLIQKLKKLSKDNTRWIIGVPNGDMVPDKDHVRTFTVPELRKKFSALGQVKFHNYEGFDKRILMSVELNKPNDDQLSLVMIAKNEGKGIEKAILSCIDFVDNISITVDNKSEDNTLKIAEKYADILKSYKWIDDFSHMRNFAQEGTKTPWTLILDGHEYVEKADKLKQSLKQDCDGIFVKVVLETGFSFYFPRIIKSNIKWEKPVHNYPATTKNVHNKNFVIVHDRPNLQDKKMADKRVKQRNRLVIGILKRKVKENKKDVRSLFYLAQQNQHTEKPKIAIKYLKKYLKYSENKEERWLARYNMAVCYSKIDKHKKAIKWFKSADKELDHRWEIDKRIGTIYLLLEKWKKALEYLVNSLETNTKEFMFNPEYRNISQTWYFIGQCFFNIKEYEKAKVAMKRSIATQTDSKFGKLPEQQIKIIDALTQ